MGRYLHALYAGTHTRKRYLIALRHGFKLGHRLSRSKAIAIARRAARVGRTAKILAVRGVTGVGTSLIQWAGVWQLWVAGVKVPHWGRGHQVVIVVMATQGPGLGLHRGQVVATWYAP